MLTILATAVLLGVLIFVHELGHFLTAKAVDIRVPRFSIGFGPKIFGFRRGETEYVLSWIPLGGYVKMAGMDEMEAVEGGDTIPVADAGALSEDVVDEAEHDDPSRHFESKSLPARFLVISAGVIMNFLFAVLLWAVIGGVWGVPEPTPAVVGEVPAEELPAGAEELADVPSGARVLAVDGAPVEAWEDVAERIATAPAGPITLRLENVGTRRLLVPESQEARAALLETIVPSWEPVIGEVMAGNPAERAGLQVGDRVVSVNGDPIQTYREFVARVEASPDRPMQLVVDRDGQPVQLTLTPNSEVAEDGSTIGRVGVASSIPRERLGLTASVGYGFGEAGRWTMAIVDMLGGLFSGQESVRNLGGPVLIGDLAGRFARAGLPYFLNFMAIFSINLAVLNLLPIPVLDGGHLVFLTVEAVRGRALSLKQRMRLSQVGLVILVAIMVLALANDLIRVVERIVAG